MSRAEQICDQNNRRPRKITAKSSNSKWSKFLVVEQYERALQPVNKNAEGMVAF